jgi:hypothetical protein
MKRFFTRMVLFVALMQTMHLSYGQSTASKQKPEKQKPEKHKPEVPIDGGISLLVAAGIGLGAAKVWKKKNSQ